MHFSTNTVWRGSGWLHLRAMLAAYRISPYFLAVATLMMVGLGLRLWGIGFGLPYQYHLDEEQYFLDATRFAYSLSFAPESWANPTLLKYLYFFEYRMFYMVGLLTGQFAGIEDFKNLVRTDPTVFYLLARATGAIFGTLTIPLVYLIGRESYNKTVGLVAALLLTGTFLHVRDSHYAVSDVPTTFFVTGVLLFSLLYLQQGHTRLIYLAAVWAGLAIATKYTAAITVIPIGLVYLFRDLPHIGIKDLLKRVWRKELVITYAIVGGVFLMIVPYSVLDWPNFLQSLRDHYGMGKIPGFAGYKIDVENGWLFYLNTLSWGLGLPLLAVSLLGWLYACYRRQQADVILVITSLLFFIVLARQSTFFARFIIPIVPILVILAARLLWVTSQRLIGLNSQVILVALTIFVLGIPLISSLRHNWLLDQPDTRTVAKNWIETNLPAGSKIFCEWYTPALSTPEFVTPNSARIYDVDKSHIIGLYERPITSYDESGYDFLIASSYIYNIPRLDPAEHAARQAYYAQLDSEFELVKTFQPYKGDVEPPFIFAQIYGPATDLFQFVQPGPTIKIYKVTAKSDEVSVWDD